MKIVEKAVVAGALLSSGCSAPGGVFEEVFGPWETTVRLGECDNGGSLERYYDRGLYAVSGRTNHSSYIPSEEALLSFAQGESLRIDGKLSLAGETYTDPEIRFERDGSIIVDSAVDANLHIWGVQTDASVYANGKKVGVIGPNIPAKVYGVVCFEQREPGRMTVGDYVPEALGLYDLARPHDFTPDPNSELADKPYAIDF